MGSEVDSMLDFCLDIFPALFMVLFFILFDVLKWINIVKSLVCLCIICRWLTLFFKEKGYDGTKFLRKRFFNSSPIKLPELPFLGHLNSMWVFYLYGDSLFIGVNLYLFDVLTWIKTLVILVCIVAQTFYIIMYVLNSLRKIFLRKNDGINHLRELFMLVKKTKNNDSFETKTLRKLYLYIFPLCIVLNLYLFDVPTFIKTVLILACIFFTSWGLKTLSIKMGVRNSLRKLFPGRTNHQLERFMPVKKIKYNNIFAKKHYDWIQSFIKKENNLKEQKKLASILAWKILNVWEWEKTLKDNLDTPFDSNTFKLAILILNLCCEHVSTRVWRKFCQKRITQVAILKIIENCDNSENFFLKFALRSFHMIPSKMIKKHKKTLQKSFLGFLQNCARKFNFNHHISAVEFFPAIYILEINRNAFEKLFQGQFDQFRKNHEGCSFFLNFKGRYISFLNGTFLEKYPPSKNQIFTDNCENPECQFSIMTTKETTTFNCDKCEMITYCSKKCQEKDWKIHKSACRAVYKLKKNFKN